MSFLYPGTRSLSWDIKKCQKKSLKYFFDFANILGCGAYGTVYKGVELSTNRPIVLKLIDIRNLGKKLIKNCRNEVRMFEKIRKTGGAKHIIEMYDSYEKDNFIYIILEYCDGGSLQDTYDKNPKFTEK